MLTKDKGLRKAVFITGGLAAGKRTACRYLCDKGATHIDTDSMAHELLADELVISQLRQLYGSGILDGYAQIDRRRLAEAAFSSPQAAAGLNQTIWPRVKELLAEILVGRSSEQAIGEEMLLVEIPMLAEAPELLDLADYVLCIAAYRELRIGRALTRGMTPADIANRLALQASDEQRTAISDLVIFNNSSPEALYAQLDRWYEEFTRDRLF